MQNFELYTPTRLLFGKDTEMEIGKRLAGMKIGKVLLHYGGGSIRKTGLYDRVTESLRQAGVGYAELGGVRPNPRVSLVYQGIELCQKEAVELILAVGGGSVIDSAKAIAAGVYYDGDIWDAIEYRKPVTGALPVAVILTIPAAGSESSMNTVISNEARGLKIGLAHECLRPVLSITNPELYATLPPEQIGAGIVDMFCHVLERYITHTVRVELTDCLCESVMKTILRNGPSVLDNPMDYDAWAEISFAGTLAHNGLLGRGRVEDWASHRMEHELSAQYDVTHGAGLAVITPAWMEYVCRENIPMFLQFATRVMGVESSLREPERTVTEGIARLRAFYRRMGMPLSLRQLGIDDSLLEQMAKKATRVAFNEPEVPVGGFKKLYWQDILEVYKLAL